MYSESYKVLGSYLQIYYARKCNNTQHFRTLQYTSQITSWKLYIVITTRLISGASYPEMYSKKRAEVVDLLSQRVT